MIMQTEPSWDVLVALTMIALAIFAAQHAVDKKPDGLLSDLFASFFKWLGL